MSDIIKNDIYVGDVNLKTPPPHSYTYAECGDLPERINVVCVWYGEKYDSRYPQVLFNSLKRHMPIPFTLYCITEHKDLDPDIVVIQPPSDVEGWWQKINLFMPGLLPQERTLFLDLDVVIVSDMSDIIRSRGDFIMIENFGPNTARAAFNSSAILWNPSPDSEKIYTCFESKVMETLHGDQCWIWRVMHQKVKAFRRDLIDSYKYSKRPKWNRTSSSTAVLVFHGKPDPHEVNDPLIKKSWR